MKATLVGVAQVQVRVRAAGAEDADAIAAVRAASWRSAYGGIIPAGILDRLTGPQATARHAAALRNRRPSGLLVAETAPDAGPDTVPDARPDAAPETPPGHIVGFANFGPERPVQGGPPPAPEHAAGTRAELYAIYVLPGFWSAGAGRALITEVLAQARAARYAAINLWVLADNARARRFYERAGFALTPVTQVLDALGGVTEVSYELRL